MTDDGWDRGLPFEAFSTLKTDKTSDERGVIGSSLTRHYTRVIHRKLIYSFVISIHVLLNVSE